MASATATDEELEAQAEAMAQKALPASLPAAARRNKLPTIKSKILERLKAQRAQAQAAPPPAAPAAAAGASGPPGAGAFGGGAPPPPGGPSGMPAASAPAPPPPPSEDHLSGKRVDGVELCGDEPWFAETVVRKRLRESVAEAHKEQKILVGNPADEIVRICPEDGRVLGAGGVLRLGGAHLGGYGESDVAYAYRQLSRALHPDKNPDLPRAHVAFHRLSEAAEELRQGLNEQRSALQTLVLAMGGQATPQMLERPQEALFAEATRILSAICGLVGEGEVPGPASSRALSNFPKSGMYYHGSTQSLVSDWFEKTQLIELFASAPVRTAYDCAPKRYRAQFLVLLNRAVVVEAKRNNDCVRGTWPMIMQTFPELGLWRQMRDAIQRRVWDTSGDPPEPVTAQPDGGAPQQRASRSRSRRRRSRSRSGDHKKGRNRFQDSIGAAADRQRDEAWDARWSTSDDPGYDPNQAKGPVKDKKQLSRDRKLAMETHPRGFRACRWGRKWRGAIAAVLPSALDTAAPFTDFEVRKLGTALWKDVVKWLTGTDSERVLGLFRADTQTPMTFGWNDKAGDQPLARGLEPGFPACEWSFIPVTDILLVVGEGVIGATTEGMLAANPSGHKRLTLAQCYKGPDYRNKRRADALAREQKLREAAEGKNSRRERSDRDSKRSKWDQGAGAR